MASDSDLGMSELQLQFGLSPDVQFSVKLNKLFIKRLETLTVKFKRLDLGTSPDRITAHLSFSDYNKLVQTCYAHKTSMKDFPEHLLQCLNSEAMHVKPPKCKQFSCFCPLSWSRDFVWSKAQLFRKRKQLEGSGKTCKKIRYSSCDRRIEKPGMEKAQSDGPPKKGRLSTPRHRKQTAQNPRKRFNRTYSSPKNVIRSVNRTYCSPKDI